MDTDDNEVEVFPRPSRLIWHGLNDPRALEFIPPEFDPFDADMLHDICGKHIGPAVGALLVALQLHRATEDSFGADHKRTAEYFVDLVRDLRKAVIKTWEEDL